MSGKTYEKAKVVVEECIPAVVEMVNAGTLSINAAAKLASLTESQQEKVAAGGLDAVKAEVDSGRCSDGSAIDTARAAGYPAGWSNRCSAAGGLRVAERFLCPCCGCRTLDERCGWDICEVCYWEDDGQDDHNADDVKGGPNGRLSLTQARVNYRAFGACEKSMLVNVRPPRSDEVPYQRHAEPATEPNPSCPDS